MQVPLEDQSPATVPRADEFAAIYDFMLEIAPEHLETPISATVDTWEDGEIRITVYHHYPGTEKREVLYYHSSEGVIRYGVESEDRVRDEQVITTVEGESPSKKQVSDATDGGCGPR